MVMATGSSDDTVLDVVNPGRIVDVEGALMSTDALVEGHEYIFTKGYPVPCHGERYKVHRYVLDVPAYQRKVLVEALTGKDQGLWFVCSVANFCVRYRPVEVINA